MPAFFGLEFICICLYRKRIPPKGHQNQKIGTFHSMMYGGVTRGQERDHAVHDTHLRSVGGVEYARLGGRCGSLRMLVRLARQPSDEWRGLWVHHYFPKGWHQCDQHHTGIAKVIEGLRRSAERSDTHETHARDGRRAAANRRE